MLLTAVPFFVVGATWRLPDTYHSAGSGRGTATLKFYDDRDILGHRSSRPHVGRPAPRVACVARTDHVRELPPTHGRSASRRCAGCPLCDGACDLLRGRLGRRRSTERGHCCASERSGELAQDAPRPTEPPTEGPSSGKVVLARPEPAVRAAIKL